MKTITVEILIPFSVVVREGEDGKFIAECPDVPGCISQGDTWSIALKNIREAIEASIKGMAAEEALRHVYEEDAEDVL